MDTGITEKGRAWHFLLLVFIALAAGIVIAGTLYYRQYEKKFRAEVEQQLAAVAKLKANELAQWHRERLNDANVLLNNPAFSELMRRFLEDPGDADAQLKLQTWINKIRTHYSYARVFLADTGGALRMSAPEQSFMVIPHLARDTASVLSSGRIEFLDFHRDTPDGAIHMAVVAPIFDERDVRRPLGAVAFRIEPADYFYPFINRWPGPSDTAETLLIRKEGNDALFLNELRFKKDSALKLRAPLTRTELPSVKAAMGHEGVVEGIDYRGVQVVGYILRVPDSPWFLVAKMDRSELYAPLRERLWMLIFFVGLLLVGSGSAVGMLWRRQNEKYFRDRLAAAEALRESEKRYRLISENAADVIWTMDLNTGRFTYVSPSVKKLRGFTPEEVMAQDLSEVLTPEHLQKYVENMPKVAADFEAGGGKPLTRIDLVDQPRKDGSIVRTEAVTTILPGKDGRAGEVLGVSRDITERTAVEEKLRESEELYRSLFENMLNGFAYCRMLFDQGRPKDFIYLAVNGSFEKLTGLKNVVGKKVSEVIPGILESDRELIETYGRVALTGRPESFERYLKALKMWFSVSVYSPKKDHFVSVFDVITARKRAEEATALQAARIETLLELHDKANESEQELFTFCLEAALRVSQSSLSFIGLMEEKESVMTIHSWSQEAMAQCAVKDKPLHFPVADAGLWANCIRQRKPVIINDYETPTAGKKGTPQGHVPLNRLLCVPVFDGKHITAVAAVANKTSDYDHGDATAISTLINKLWEILRRKHTEEALRQSEEKFANAFQTSPYTITITRPSDGKFIEVNDAFTSTTGYSREEALADSSIGLRMWADMEDRNRIVAELRGGGTVAGREVRFRKKDGGTIVGLFSAKIVRLGGETCILSSINDITELKRAEEEKARLADQLLQAMKMEAVGRLAGGVAHDFNNLLTGITGNIAMALMDLKPEDPLAATLTDVNKAAESAAALTRQLLAFSRKQIIEPKVLNINDLLTNLHKMLVRLIGENIDLKTIPAERLASVKADPAQVEQIVINLAVNARDAMPDGGRLIMETADVELDADYCRTHAQVQPGRYVMLAVSDTGEGMSGEVKEHLFEPFFTTKPMGRGTGLGLATIYGTVKQSGGSIEVYSEIGKGSTFKVYLPAVEEKAEAPARQRRITDLPGGTETVLVVEDEEMVRQFAVRMLGRLGYKVLNAPDGEKGLLLAEEYKDRIDLLITDVVMPGINGRQLAEKLKCLHPETTVLFTSGYTENVIVHQGVLEESLNFMGKPYTPQSLANKIREVLGKKA